MTRYSYLASEKLGSEIASVLGLDPSMIVSMRIEMNVGQPVAVIVEMLLPPEAGDVMTTEFTRYKLVENDEP